MSNNLDFDQLLEEIEAIVNSGTKINISYFLDEYIDEEDQDEVFEYFRECDTDDLDEAYRQLCPDYKEEEVRLLRIKSCRNTATDTPPHSHHIHNSTLHHPLLPPPKWTPAH